MKVNVFRFVLALVLVLFVMAPLGLLAQTGEDDIVIPSFFEVILSAQLLAAVTQVVGSVQYLKKIFRLKGWYSVVVTVIAGFAYSFYAYFTVHGLPFTLAVGATVAVAAILSYAAAKAVGENLVSTERGPDIVARR